MPWARQVRNGSYDREKFFDKISVQPHTTSCIQFLDRENNDKNKYIAIGETDLFYNSMGLCGNFTGVIVAFANRHDYSASLHDKKYTSYSDLLTC